MVKTEKLLIFGSVRFALFVKSLKTVRFLERYGSRYKILTENGNEICTVRFVLFNEKTEHGRLFGAVWLADKNINGQSFFFNLVSNCKKSRDYLYWNVNQVFVNQIFVNQVHMIFSEL